MCHLCEERSYDGAHSAASLHAPAGHEAAGLSPVKAPKGPETVLSGANGRDSVGPAGKGPSR